jgi:hypothetical protein
MNLRSILIFGTSLPLVAVSQAQTLKDVAPPDSYIVTMAGSPSGSGVTQRIYRDGSKVVVDRFDGPPSANPTAPRIRTLYNIDQQTATTWKLPDSSGGCVSVPFSGDWGDPFANYTSLTSETSRSVGEEPIQGMTATVYETSMGANGVMKAWIESQTGLVFKAELTPPGGAPNRILEVTDVAFRPPATTTFALPANCKLAALKTQAEQPQTSRDLASAQTAPVIYVGYATVAAITRPSAPADGLPGPQPSPLAPLVPAPAQGPTLPAVIAEHSVPDTVPPPADPPVAAPVLPGAIAANTVPDTIAPPADPPVAAPVLPGAIAANTVPDTIAPPAEPPVAAPALPDKSVADSVPGAVPPPGASPAPAPGLSDSNVIVVTAGPAPASAAAPALPDPSVAVVPSGSAQTSPALPNTSASAAASGSAQLSAGTPASALAPAAITASVPPAAAADSAQATPVAAAPALAAVRYRPPPVQSVELPTETGTFPAPPVSAAPSPSIPQEVLSAAMGGPTEPTPAAPSLLPVDTSWTASNPQNFSKATSGPGTRDDCSVLLKIVKAGTMEPITAGVQVGIGSGNAAEHLIQYGQGALSHTGVLRGMYEILPSVRDGAFRIGHVPMEFTLATSFGVAGNLRSIVYLQCFAPETTLLLVVRNPARIADGAQLLWVKTGQYASIAK